MIESEVSNLQLPKVAAKASSANMLALPMEMLQHIISLTDYTDLISLRLTCKKLEAASFDAFSAEYLHELTCFVMDRDQIKRAITIISSHRLGYKVRSLEMTWDPDRGCASYLAQFINGKHDDDPHHLYTTPDSTDLRTLLGNVRSSNIELILECHDCWTATMLAGRSLVLRDHLLDAVATSGCAIAELNICIHDSTRLQTLVANEDAPLIAATENLRRVWYNVHDKPVSEDDAKRGIEAALKLVRKATKLQHLRFTLSDRLHVGSPAWLVYQTLPQELLKINSLATLRKLGLSRQTLEQSVLLDLLQRCHNTLESLDLQYVSSTTPGVPWIGVLQHLLRAPRLCKLHLEHLHGPDPFDSIWLVNPTSADSKLTREIFLHGEFSVRSGLAMVLDHGLRCGLWRAHMLTV